MYEDSLFTYTPLIQKIAERGLDLIGMVKPVVQRYLVGNR